MLVHSTNQTIDVLLKLRSAYAAQLVKWRDESRRREADARAEARSYAAWEYRAEAEAIEDALSVFLRLVDEELRKLTTSNTPAAAQKQPEKSA